MRRFVLQLLWGMVVLTMGWSFCSPLAYAGGAAPNFLGDFAKPLLTEGGYGDEKAYKFDVISQDNKFIDNVKALFYPDPNSDTAVLWKFLRILAIVLFFALLVWAGFQFILNADVPDAINKAKMSLLYILLGAAIFFLSWRILSKLLNLGSIEGLYGGTSNNTLADKANSLFLTVLAILKAAAFFVALFFIAWYGFKIVTALGEDGKVTAARQGVLNVVFALIFIKVIDYLYYIALKGNFTNDAIDFIVQASKFISYVFGAALVISLVYAGYLMLTSTGDEENVKKAKNIVKSVFVVGLLVLLFLLIIHQIFKDIYT